jgi:hypothetical protein
MIYVRNFVVKKNFQGGVSRFSLKFQDNAVTIDLETFLSLPRRFHQTIEFVYSKE